MAIVTSDLLLLTQAGIKTEFNNAYLEANEKADWRQIATELPTTLPIQRYAWLGRGAVMQPFADEIKEQALREDTYQLADILYKGALVIDRRMIEDDQYGLIMLRVRELAQEPVRHWNQLAFQGLVAGFSQLCYDGQYFFNANHQEGSSPIQSNITTAPLSDASLEAAATAMMSFVDDKGIPMHVVPDTLVVGPLLARRAWNLVAQDIVYQPSEVGTAGVPSTPYRNYFNGRYKLVINPYISGYQWFLLDCSREVKPIVIQNRSDVPITLETDMDMPEARIRERYHFTVRGRYVQGYGLWQLAYGSNATA
ncbi:Mu-like prophage major head subunit gpT family protein [Chthonomonas calidirosea]|uniref:Mu-like prophage major head subunit gpT family protein n=1 Tax=Chthonomonas calidirosea TaxID=454171 RepID=UPI0006EC47C0|nr:Mu-like prophage major head subunit gpT family protein [Chthonomonas calidirosea]CEK19946.1 Mu-like prophage major head subunit gpT [Chthonomonas calidirosea]